MASDHASHERIDNILHKYEASIPDKWQQNILAEPAEIALANELDEKLPKLDILLNEQNYMGAMEAINSFVPGLNNFFEKQWLWLKIFQSEIIVWRFWMRLEKPLPKLHIFHQCRFNPGL